jgi:hypothetical protein
MGDRLGTPGAVGFFVLFLHLSASSFRHTFNCHSESLRTALMLLFCFIIMFPVLDDKQTKIFGKNNLFVGDHKLMLTSCPKLANSCNSCPKLVNNYNFGQITANKRQSKQKCTENLDDLLSLYFFLALNP